MLDWISPCQMDIETSYYFIRVTGLCFYARVRASHEILSRRLIYAACDCLRITDVHFTSLFLFFAHGLQERRVWCSATILDRTLGHIHRVVATLVRVRGAHPTVDRFACATQNPKKKTNKKSYQKSNENRERSQ